MYVGDFKKMLDESSKSQLSCRNCGKKFTLQAGYFCAFDHGIREQVVVCPQCHSAYGVDVTPRGVTLLADVTERYWQQLPAPRPKTAPKTAAGKKWWQFWK
jgi:hypothetical protein